MNLSPSVAQLQREHVVMELECIDRMYLNAYIPKLTSEAGVAGFLRGHLGNRFASTKQAGEMTDAFVRSIRQFLQEQDVGLYHFKKGERKDDVFKRFLRGRSQREGVVFVGVAQEKVRVPRTIRKQFNHGPPIPWISYSSALVNVYYFYCWDDDFGPFFIKFCSYFPYFAKLCINGHEYLKRQLIKRSIPFESLDNGLLSCADLAVAQRICDHLDATKIDAFFRKWLRLLPHPYSPRDRRAGYRYDLSILQAEFSLTQIWDRGAKGRCFFEEVIRENIDLGRPEQIQLIFGRKLQKSTVAAGRCRTRIINEGVIPSLHVYYKNTHLKQYHKEGRALRTETTINDTYDFGVGRRLANLPQLRKIGFAANRRVLEVEKISHDCNIGANAFEQMQKPAEVQGQRASALRFGDARVQALFAAVVLFCLQPQGFTNKQLRPLLAQLLGLPESDITQGRMSYDLRRLRLHGIVQRVDKSHRYQLTAFGLKTALFYSRTYSRVIRPGLSLLSSPIKDANHKITSAFNQFDRAVVDYLAQQKAA